MRKIIFSILATSIVLVGVGVPAQASDFDPTLADVYAMRADLQLVFDSETWQAIPGSAAGFLLDLEDWATQYGWQEHPELADYAPEVAPPTTTAVVDEFPELTAENYIVIDRNSGIILAEQRSAVPWVMASITKLMTVYLAMNSGVDMYSIESIYTSDDVGGAKLYVDNGDEFTMLDIVYAAMVGSANNAAKAIARIVGPSETEFVAAMNAQAKEFGLYNTSFVDPTGIEVDNWSTAREIARMADKVFFNRDIRRFTSTASRTVYDRTRDQYKTITNTNRMLYKTEFDDVYVTSGKTGLLYESGWNVVVSMRPNGEDEHKELLIVTLGSQSRIDCFRDTEKIADWVWDNFEWDDLEVVSSL